MELLPHNWPLSVVHVVSRGRQSHPEHCSCLFRTAASQSAITWVSTLLSTRTGRLTKKHERKHKSPRAKCLLDASKCLSDASRIQFLLESGWKLQPLPPGMHPTTTQVAVPSPLHGFGPFQAEPWELVYTLQGRKWITLHSTETAAGLKEVNQIESVTRIL